MKPQALVVVTVIAILLQLCQVFAQQAPHQVDANTPCSSCHNGDNPRGGIPAGQAPEASFAPPTITSATATSVSVSGVLSGELVDVYLSDGSGLGTTLIGSAMAGGASVTVTVSGVNSGQWITARRTSFSNSIGNISEFSPNVQVQ